MADEATDPVVDRDLYVLAPEMIQATRPVYANTVQVTTNGTNVFIVFGIHNSTFAASQVGTIPVATVILELSVLENFADNAFRMIERVRSDESALRGDL